MSEIKAMYVNSVRFAISVHDLMIDMEVIGPDDQRELLARVFMSPQHAKEMSLLLARHIDAYEDAYGRLPTPPPTTPADAAPATGGGS